jgi:hypothetical protein
MIVPTRLRPEGIETMHFVLAGFRQSDHTRRYYFDAIDEDHQRTRVTVDADVNLVRKYGISLQELPLLCRQVLEEHPSVSSVDFTEPEMALCADKRAAARGAIEHRPARRRAPLKDAGQAWRGLSPSQTKMSSDG